MSHTSKESKTSSACLLAVGYYPELLALRSHLLRQNGYRVEEAGDLHSAMAVAQRDGNKVQLLLFCHSVPVEDQSKIMMEFLRRRRVRALSICRLEHAKSFPGTPVSIAPEDLLAQVTAALGQPA
jgi:CheY-like chemotaxis protein